jgi:hypothetical protein
MTVTSEYERDCPFCDETLTEPGSIDETSAAMLLKHRLKEHIEDDHGTLEIIWKVITG